MKLENLIEELRGDLPFAGLEQLNNAFEEDNSTELINDFLLVSTNCDEILQLLEKEKRSAAELGSIFSALGTILFGIANDLKKFASVGHHICRDVLHNRITHLYKITGTSSTNKNVVAALRFLTGLVMLGEASALEVLGSIEWNKMHIKSNLNRRDKLSAIDVRGWSVYLLLSFLNSTEISVLIKFLQNPEPFTLLFPGLALDPYERVINAIKMMQDSIIKNSNISKTIKTKLFTHTTVKPLLSLYNWTGQDAKSQTANIVEEELQLEQKLSIRKSFHQMMLLLCSSNKYGVIFKETIFDDPKKSNNFHVLHIIKKFETPWDLPETRELVAETLGACPDLLRHYNSVYKDFLTPRPTMGFLSILSYLETIISKQKPWKRVQKDNLNAMANVSIPLVNLKFITSLVKSPYDFIRHAGAKIVLAILSKVMEICDVLGKLADFPETKIKETRKLIIATAAKIIGPCDLYVFLWNVATGTEIITVDKEEQNNKSSEEVSSPSATEILETIAKVLVLHCDLGLHPTSFKSVKPLSMLEYIRVHQETSSKDADSDTLDYINLQSLCLQLFSEDISQIVSYSKDNFDEEYQKDVFYQLISTYQSASASSKIVNDIAEFQKFVKVCDRCCNLLTKALTKCGTATQESAKLWLEYVSGKHWVEKAKYLAKVLHELLVSLSYYSDKLLNISSEQQKVMDVSLIDNKMDFKLLNAQVEDNEDVLSVDISLPFSLLVLSAMDILTQNPKKYLKKYFCDVLFDYTHTLREPDVLIYYLYSKQDSLTKPFQDYIGAWQTKELISESFQPQTESLKDDLTMLFRCQVSTKKENIDLTIPDTLFNDPDDVLNLVNQLVSYVYFEIRHKPECSKLSIYLSTLENIINLILEKFGFNNILFKVLKIYLQHPTLVKSYVPFTKKSKLSASIFKLIKDLCQKKCELMDIVKPYFDKTVKDFSELSWDEFFSDDVLTPFDPFLSSDVLIITFNDIENLLYISFGLLEQRHEKLEKLICDLSDLVICIKCSKLSFSSKTLALMYDKFISLSKFMSPSANDNFLEKVEDLLVLTFDKAYLNMLTEDNLRSLLNLHSNGGLLLRKILSLVDEHSKVIWNCIKGKGLRIPHQAPLIAHIIENKSYSIYAEEISKKISIDFYSNFTNEKLKFSQHFSTIFCYYLEKNKVDCATIGKLIDFIYKKAMEKEEILENYMIDMVRAMDKYSNSLKNISLEAPMDCPLTALVHSLMSSLKMLYLSKQGKNTVKLVCELLTNLVLKVNSEDLKKSYGSNGLWDSFLDSCLAVALTDVDNGHFIIDVVTKISATLYKRGKNKGIYLPSNIFDIFINTDPESSYIKLMISKESKYQKLKEAILRLHLELAQSKISVCEETHVPVLLGAYGASMSVCDQIILVLLKIYETGGKMETIQPVLWGISAIEHFNLLSGSTLYFTRDCTPQQIISCLDYEKVIHSCLHFDTQLEIEPEIVKENPDVYDLRFLLPLMLHMSLNIDQLDNDMKYAENGILPIGVAALTSHKSSVWNLGATLLRAICEIMEKSRHRRMKLQYVWFVSAISYSMDGKDRRISSLSANFLIKAASLLARPDHDMYVTIMNFMYKRPSFKLNEVPLLYQLFSSSHTKFYEQHKLFLLDMLSEGIREKRDFRMVNYCYTTKLVLSLLMSYTASKPVKISALNAINSVAKINLGAVHLVTKESILAVLTAVIDAAVKDNEKTCANIGNSVVQVMNTLWNTLISSISNSYIEMTKDSHDGEESHKRKRKLKEKSSKKMKTDKLEQNSEDNLAESTVIDGEMEFDSSSDEEQNPKLDEPSKIPKTLPPLFIKEFLSSILYISKPILTHCPMSTCSDLLNLIKQLFLHLVLVEKYSDETYTIRLMAISTEQTKHQILSKICWSKIRERITTYLTHDEEYFMLQMEGKIDEDFKFKPLSEFINKNKLSIKDEDMRQCTKVTIELLNLL